MNSNINRRLDRLRTEDYIWYIYVFIAVFALISNKYEKSYVVTKKREDFEKYHTINETLFVVALLIYLYFLYANYEQYKEKRDSLTWLNLIVSILFIIGGVIALYVEVSSNGDTDEELFI